MPVVIAFQGTLQKSVLVWGINVCSHVFRVCDDPRLTSVLRLQNVDAMRHARVPRPRNYPEQGPQQGGRLVGAGHPHLRDAYRVRGFETAIHVCNDSWS